MECNRQRRDWQRGGITIFSAIVLAAVFFLNGVLLDWAAVQTAKENLPYKFHLAGNSLLAGFESILFQDYCLMACQEKEGAESRVKYYFTGRDEPSLLEIFCPGKLLPVSVLSGSLANLRVQYEGSLADINILQETIIDTMQYRTPANLLTYLLDALDIVKSAEKMSEGEALFLEAGELLDELSKGAETLYRLVEGWSANDISCVNGFDNVPAREKMMALLKTDTLAMQFVQGEALQQEESKKALQRMRENCYFLISDLENYLNLHKKAISAVHSVRAVQKNCEPRVTAMEQWLADYIPENEQEIGYGEKLKERIAELRSLMAKLEYSAALKSLEENIHLLEKGISAGNALSDHLDAAETIGVEKEFIWEQLSVMQCKTVKSNIRIYTGDGAVDEGLSEQDPRESAQSSSASVITGMDAVAEIEETLFKTLPSICDSFDTAVLKDDALWKSVLIDDYVLSYFNTAAGTVRTGYSFLTGEAEYILSGERCDADNLKSAQNKILGIRTVLNLQHVLCDTDKMNLARAIGNAIAGALTCGIGGPLFTALVAGGWALGEAALDVRDLKDGKEVPLLKTKETWKLSIAGLAGSLTEQKPDVDAPFALDYNGYLRILLLLTPQKTKLARIADLIELNLSKQTNVRYYLGDLYTAVTITYQFLVPVSSAARWFLPEKSRKGAHYVISGEVTAEY